MFHAISPSFIDNATGILLGKVNFVAVGRGYARLILPCRLALANKLAVVRPRLAVIDVRGYHDLLLVGRRRSRGHLTIVWSCQFRASTTGRRDQKVVL